MDRLWWNHITRAHKFLEDIISSALDGKSMILCLPEHVPWRDTLLELVEDRLQLENPKNALDRMQCPEEEAGLFLLNRYCKAARRATYRFGMTYAEFLGKCEDTVLNDRYLWVSGIPKSRYEYRSSFIRKYRNQIVGALPITTSYGEQVANPEEVEIGVLVYLAGNGKIPLESREYETLAAFREARNRLAHLNTLEPDAVDLILREGNSL